MFQVIDLGTGNLMKSPMVPSNLRSRSKVLVRCRCFHVPRPESTCKKCRIKVHGVQDRKGVGCKHDILVGGISTDYMHKNGKQQMDEFSLGSKVL